MTTVLGLNSFHPDASACLVVDGRLVAAAEEERFRRIKHWAGFPREAVGYCLREAGLGIEDVDHVAVNRHPLANLPRKLLFLVRHRPTGAQVLARLRNRRRVASIPGELAALAVGARARVHAVEHHRAHLVSAALASPASRCLVVSVDQFGDFASTAWGVADGARVSVDARVSFPHSLGTFYSALTQFLGFPSYGDEYKVMGLAPRGEPTYLEALRRVLRSRPDGTFELDLRYFRHHRELVYQPAAGEAPQVADLFSPELERLLGPRRRRGEPLERRHEDLARSVQARYEEALFALLCALHTRYRLDALALAGGCAMNSVANGKVTRETPFRRVDVQAAAGDAGGALGAAFDVWARLAPGGARYLMTSAYLGPAFGAAEVAAALAERAADLERSGCAVSTIADEGALCEAVAAALAEGQVIGWFQGRMEWGPRALGNRSILGDPRRADMKDILNSKIKRRESFRPFAPSVLREATAAWFEVEADVPFMMHVFPVRSDRRPLVPAVTHVDGSGRLQTVRREDNPRYHRLIQAFAERTGVPMVLNTSFNENEPIVCRPAEAVDCFLRTDMDLLVLGDTLVARRRLGG
ncbi:MAG: carbamoyltransferase [Planctomycetes bacterium]|nr:carbamoyltransferase [Planctomycetota bacterium]